MKPFKAWILLAALFLLPGCASTERFFNAAEVEPAPADKGLVYFYRPAEMAAGDLNIMLYNDGVQISRIQNGQFIKYPAAPGKHRFYTNTIEIDRAIELDVAAGVTYFVKLGLRQGMWSGTWALTRIFPDEAIKEINICCKHDFTEPGSRIYDETGVIGK